MTDPEIAVILEEIGQTHVFVAQRREEQHIAGPDLRGAVGHEAEREMLAKRADLGPFAPKPHPV